MLDKELHVLGTLFGGKSTLPEMARLLGDIAVVKKSKVLSETGLMTLAELSAVSCATPVRVLSPRCFEVVGGLGRKCRDADDDAAVYREEMTIKGAPIINIESDICFSDKGGEFWAALPPQDVDCKLALTSNMGIVRIRDIGVIRPSFLCCFLNHSRVREFLQYYLNGGKNSFISKNDLHALAVPCPSLELQEMYESFWNKIIEANSARDEATQLACAFAEGATMKLIANSWPADGHWEQFNRELHEEEGWAVDEEEEWRRCEEGATRGMELGRDL